MGASSRGAAGWLLRLAVLGCGLALLAAGFFGVLVDGTPLVSRPAVADRASTQVVGRAEYASTAETAAPTAERNPDTIVAAASSSAASGWVASTPNPGVKASKNKDKEKPPKVTPPDDPPAAAPGVPVLTACTSGDMADVVAFEPAAAGGPVATFSLLRAASPDGAFSVVATLGPDARSFTYPVTECATAYYAVAAEGPGGASGASTSAPNARVAIAGEVTPGGRTFRASNGEVALTLAPGSYATTTTVTVDELAGTATGPFIALAGIYDIGPSGPLGAPATLSVAYTLDVEQPQIVDVLLRAAGLMTYDAATASWVRVADAHLEGSYLTGTLAHFSPYTNGTYQPHGTSGLAVNYCTGVCHDLTLPTDAAIRIDARDPQVCYFCHGNEPHTASAAGVPGGRNIEAEFFDVLGQPLPAARTTHPVGSGLDCTSCHDPHKNPAVAGNEDLLRAYDAVSGAAVTSGDGFCWTCHGIIRNRRVSASIQLFRPGYDYFTATGGDHKTGYATSAHAGVTENGSVTCTNCHGAHGGAEGSLLPASQYSTCTGAGVGCHSDPGNAAGGSDIKEQLDASANSLAHHDVNPATRAAGAAIECTSCHNAHKNSAASPISDPDNLQVSMSAGTTPPMLDANGSAWLRVGAEHDAIQPTISGVVLTTGAQWLSPVVSWTTNEAATSWIEWGTTTAYGSTAGNNNLALSHTLAMSGLVGGTTYNYRIRTADALGNMRISANYTYTPVAPPATPVMIDLGTLTGNNDGLPVSVETSCAAVTAPDGHAVQYRFMLNGLVVRDWALSTTCLLSCYDGTYNVVVQARDSVHPAAVSDWSAPDTFYVVNAPDPGSCPDLFTWDGTAYTFVSDVMGLGPIGVQKRNGEYVRPEPVEDTVIPEGLLVPRSGSLDMHLTVDRVEVEYIDEVKLVAVDHPAGTRLLTNDLHWSAAGVARPATEYYTIANPRMVAATYERVPVFGDAAIPPTEVSAEVSAEGDGLVAYAGLYDDNIWTFDLGELGDPDDIKLVVSGWTEYPNDAEKAAWLATGKQRPASRIEVRDAGGNWVDVGPAAFIPGYPKTVVYDLAGAFPDGVTEYRVRIRTYQRMNVDYVAVDTTPDAAVTTRELSPSRAELSYRGVSRDTTTPYPVFDFYDLVDHEPPVQTGAFTRYGDVAELLAEPDDMFVIMDTGDDVAISFDEPGAPAAGMTRTYVIHTDGYHDTLSGTVEPLPFHGMSNYPYGADEHYPDDAAHQDYLAEWNTRIKAAPVAGSQLVQFMAQDPITGARVGALEILGLQVAPVVDAGSVAYGDEVGELPYSVDTNEVFARITNLQGAVVTVPLTAGWQSTTASFATGPTPSSPGTAVANLSGAASRDASWWTTDLTGTTNGAVNWQLMRFDVPVPGWTVRNIELVWYGHGEPTAGYELKVDVWNPSTSAWTELRNQVTGTDTQVTTSSASPGLTAYCLRCHDGAPPAGVSMPTAGIRSLATWASASGDYHGGRSGTGTGGTLVSGYTRGTQVPCGDCHDSHGSASIYHFPSTMGSTTLPTVTSGTNVAPLCTSCHVGTLNSFHGSMPNGDGCWCHGIYNDGHDNAYIPTLDVYLVDCFDCHAHGASWTHPNYCWTGCTEHGSPPSSPRTF